MALKWKSCSTFYHLPGSVQQQSFPVGTGHFTPDGQLFHTASIVANNGILHSTGTAVGKNEIEGERWEMLTVFFFFWFWHKLQTLAGEAANTHLTSGMKEANQGRDVQQRPIVKGGATSRPQSLP